MKLGKGIIRPKYETIMIAFVLYVVAFISVSTGLLKFWNNPFMPYYAIGMFALWVLMGTHLDNVLQKYPRPTEAVCIAFTVVRGVWLFIMRDELYDMVTG